MKIYKTLTIAGFDGSGGAGIQADLKTFSALGCYAATALTALPIQNSMGVRGVYEIPASAVEEQIRAVLDDMEIDAIKIGMLHRQEIALSVARTLSDYPVSNIVLDPVMVAKSGDLLLLPEAIEEMKKTLFPMADVITPNLLEASRLLGRNIKIKEEMERAAADLLELGPKAVLLKGGHLKESSDDCLYLGNEDFHWFSTPKIATRNTHGTGCTLSAAIAAFLARGESLYHATLKAKEYLTSSIAAWAQGSVGRGNGPVHHFHRIWEGIH